MIGLRKAQNEALVTDTSIEKKQLAEEPHLLQTAIKKPWAVSLSRLGHNTPSFPSTSIFFENGTFTPKRLADALLAFFDAGRGLCAESSTQLILAFSRQSIQEPSNLLSYVISDSSVVLDGLA